MGSGSNGTRDRTVRFRIDDGVDPVSGIIFEVLKALGDKGYDPVKQLVGYLLSGDPTYITSHGRARSLIRTVERDHILEVLVQEYVRKVVPPEPEKE